MPDQPANAGPDDQCRKRQWPSVTFFSARDCDLRLLVRAAGTPHGQVAFLVADGNVVGSHRSIFNLGIRMAKRLFHRCRSSAYAASQPFAAYLPKQRQGKGTVRSRLVLYDRIALDQPRIKSDGHKLRSHVRVIQPEL